MQRYNFVASWIPRRDNSAADALSRPPVDQPTPDDELAEGPPSFSARLAIVFVIEGSSPTAVDPVLKNIQDAAARDPVMIDLRETILHGFRNEKCNLSLALLLFGLFAIASPSTTTTAW